MGGREPAAARPLLLSLLWCVMGRGKHGLGWGRPSARLTLQMPSRALHLASRHANGSPRPVARCSVEGRHPLPPRNLGHVCVVGPQVRATPAVVLSRPGARAKQVPASGTQRRLLDADHVSYLHSLRTLPPVPPSPTPPWDARTRRKWLPVQGWEGEALLWQRICDEARIVITTGRSCHAAEPGFFRICFAWVSPEALLVAADRLDKLLNGPTGK